MSGVYWGIVARLLAMVATLFVCIDIAYSAGSGSPKTSSGSVEGAAQAGTHTKASPRQAA
ncbi:MAG: hypothetical protein JSR20_14860 [Nitrospira sp.]|nr:hypothetical protein [Nitrospira sp.]